MSLLAHASCAGTLGGWSILHIACDTCDAHLLKLCLETRGVDLNLPEATRGETPLHLAADDRNEAFVALLLGQASLEVDKASTNGSTALHFAAKREHCGIARRLLAAGADPNRRRVFRWRTPLHLACSVSSKGTVTPELLQELVRGGSDPNARDREMMTPAHVLAASGGGVASTDRSLSVAAAAVVSPSAPSDAATACAVALWRGGASFQLRDLAGLTPGATAQRHGHSGLAAWFNVLESEGAGLRMVLDEVMRAAGGRAGAVAALAAVLGGGGAPTGEGGGGDSTGDCSTAPLPALLGGRRFTRVPLPAVPSTAPGAAATPLNGAPAAAAAAGGSDGHAPLLAPAAAANSPELLAPLLPPTARFRGMALPLDLHALPDRALGRISEFWGGCWSPGSDAATRETIAAEAAVRRAEVRGRSGSGTSASAGDKQRSGDKQRPTSDSGSKQAPALASAVAADADGACVSVRGGQSVSAGVTADLDEAPEDPPAPPLSRDDSFEQD